MRSVISGSDDKHMDRRFSFFLFFSFYLLLEHGLTLEFHCLTPTGRTCDRAVIGLSLSKDRNATALVVKLLENLDLSLSRNENYIFIAKAFSQIIRVIKTFILAYFALLSSYSTYFHTFGLIHFFLP